MKILLAVFLAALTCAVVPSHAATAVNLQVCLTTPSSSNPGNVAGCPQGSFLFAAVAPDSLVRSQVGNVQGWRAFKSLSATDQVYAADGAWHPLSLITPALQPASPVPPPVVTTPACPPPKDTWAAVQWTCNVTAGVATCTAPLSP